MKKKIRSEIVKLAKQILAEDESFNSASMKLKVAQLYEQLSVLDYLESQIRNEGPYKQSQSLDSKSFREENWFTEPEPLPQSQHQEDLVEPLMEKIKDIVAQMPEESHKVDELLEEVMPKKKLIKNDLEEFASRYPHTPTFERKEPSKGVDVVDKQAPKTFPADKNIKTQPPGTEDLGTRPQSINDKLHQGLNIGLNDRLAFTKHLFDGKAEEYTRVISQISNMRSYDEASGFIKGKIKPAYNYWLKKEEYSERFMTIIEKSFN